MGFSVVPPKPDLKIAVQSLEVWTKRADAAIMHLDVPWALLLAGTSPEDALRKDGIDLERYYRSKRLQLVEGGWPSASVRGMFSSSSEMQARYIACHSKLLDEANAIAAFQLSFADLDLGSFPKPIPAIKDVGRGGVILAHCAEEKSHQPAGPARASAPSFRCR